VTPAELRQAAAELDLVRRRRELLFWTIRMTLVVIVLVAMTIAFLAALVKGTAVDPAQMLVAGGITGTSAAGGQLLCRLGRFGCPPADVP
jgi:hypothetical protein